MDKIYLFSVFQRTKYPQLDALNTIPQDLTQPYKKEMSMSAWSAHESKYGMLICVYVQSQAS